MKIYALSSFFSALKTLIGTTTPSGFTATKLMASLKLGIFLAPLSFLNGFDFWYQTNAIYLNFVITAICLDWVIGTIKHIFYLKDFHFKKNLGGILIKLILTLTLGIVFEGLKYLTIEVNFIVKYLMIALRLAVFMYPASSIIRSSWVITDGKFPPKKLVQRIEAIADSLIKQKKDV